MLEIQETEEPWVLESDDENVENEMEASGAWGLRYEPDQCTAEDLDGVRCTNLKNPSEQQCHDCRVFGHRLTGLL